VKIRRGQQAGTQYTPHQFANNWISVKEASHVYNPLQVELDDDAEVHWFLDQDDPNKVGSFWSEWELDRQSRIFRRREPVEASE
jgi:hypothetical protein